MRLSEAKTFETLIGSGYGASVLNDYFNLLVYDNSKVATDELCLHTSRCQYVHNSSNGGLAAAYNCGLAHAIQSEAEWILLLDQDTELPSHFLQNLKTTIENVSLNEKVVAVVPKVFSNDVLISPSRVNWAWRLSKFPVNEVGCVNYKISGINSGSAIRVSFLKESGGFDKTFKLDYLDHWLFSKIWSAKRRVYVSENIINHDLSIQDVGKNVSKVRYESILLGEFLFFSKYGTRSEYAYYLARLLMRSIRQAFHTTTKVHSQMTLKQFVIALTKVYSS